MPMSTLSLLLLCLLPFHTTNAIDWPWSRSRPDHVVGRPSGRGGLASPTTNKPPRNTWVIPRILHQINTLPSSCPRSQLQEVVPGKYLNKALAANIAELRQLNPNWTYRLWDHQSISAFLTRHRHVMNYELGLKLDEDVKNMYDSINPHYGSARCDFFRYTVMYMFGGVYMDLKSFSHIPLDQILQPTDGFVAINEWDQRHFPGWGNYYVDDVPGRGIEHPSWFIASAPRHPIMKTIFQKVFEYYRRYTGQCMEYRMCPTGLVYRYKDDNTFDRISWPKKRDHCYGNYGTLVMLGPILYSVGVVAAQHAAGPAVDKLKLRLVPADLHANLVYDFRMLNRSKDKSVQLPSDLNDKSDRQALYCTNAAVYQLQQEPIYLPLHISVQLFQRRIKIPREPSASLDCPNIWT